MGMPIDLTKVFYTVDQNILLHKLEIYETRNLQLN